MLIGRNKQEILMNIFGTVMLRLSNSADADRHEDNNNRWLVENMTATEFLLRLLAGPSGIIRLADPLTGRVHELNAWVSLKLAEGMYNGLHLFVCRDNGLNLPSYEILEDLSNKVGSTLAPTRNPGWFWANLFGVSLPKSPLSTFVKDRSNLADYPGFGTAVPRMNTEFFACLVGPYSDVVQHLCGYNPYANVHFHNPERPFNPRTGIYFDRENMDWKKSFYTMVFARNLIKYCYIGLKWCYTKLS